MCHGSPSKFMHTAKACYIMLVLYVVHIIRLKTTTTRITKLGIVFSMIQRGCSIGWKKQANRQGIFRRKKNITYRYIK